LKEEAKLDSLNKVLLFLLSISLSVLILQFCSTFQLTINNSMVFLLLQIAEDLKLVFKIQRELSYKVTRVVNGLQEERSNFFFIIAMNLDRNIPPP